MPNQAGSYFADTVTYLCRHDDEGAFGLILNRPMDLAFGTLMAQAGIPVPEEDEAARLYRSISVRSGGPVHPEQGIVLHSLDVALPETEDLGQGLGLSFSRDMLEAIAEGRGPGAVLFALGYAGWGAGQLEAELAQDAWLVIGTPDSQGSIPAASHRTLFETDATRSLDAVAAMTGADLTLLSGRFGHA
jgi:putative transcriptional regulator